MLGYQMIVLWFIAFFAVFYPAVHNLSRIDATVAYWSFWTVCVAIFEAMLTFCHEYVCKKGHEYYENGGCLGLEEGKSLMDIFTYQFYMDTYADYSLADHKYRRGIGHDGFHFALFGEVWHGVFSGIAAIASLYYLYAAPKSNEFMLSVFSLGLIQLTMIIWYVSPVILELFIDGHENHMSKWWWPPFLWNVPWFTFPPILIYYGAAGILGERSAS